MSVVHINHIEYQIQQVNGQRIVGPLEEYKQNGADVEHKEIFVGRIPKTISEIELVKIFSEIGPVFKFRLMMNFSGENRGFGYLQYVFENDFHKALQMLRGKEVQPGKFLRVCISKNICTLVMGGIYGNFTPHQVLDALGRMLDLKSATWTVKSDVVKYFLTFRTHRDAALGRRSLLSILPYYGRHGWIRWAKEEVISWRP